MKAIDYNKATQELELILQKATKLGGFNKLNKKESETLMNLTNKVQSYEQVHFSIGKPKTLIEWIELKMYEYKLNQKQLAKKLDIPETRLSEFMKGKKKLNIELAKKLNSELKIDANEILSLA